MKRITWAEVLFVLLVVGVLGYSVWTVIEFRTPGVKPQDPVTFQAATTTFPASTFTLPPCNAGVEGAKITVEIDGTIYRMKCVASGPGWPKEMPYHWDDIEPPVINPPRKTVTTAPKPLPSGTMTLDKHSSHGVNENYIVFVPTVDELPASAGAFEWMGLPNGTCPACFTKAPVFHMNDQYSISQETNLRMIGDDLLLLPSYGSGDNQRVSRLVRCKQCRNAFWQQAEDESKKP